MDSTKNIVTSSDVLSDSEPVGLTQPKKVYVAPSLVSIDLSGTNHSVSNQYDGSATSQS